MVTVYCATMKHWSMLCCKMQLIDILSYRHEHVLLLVNICLSYFRTYLNIK